MITAYAIFVGFIQGWAVFELMTQKQTPIKGEPNTAFI
jgi:hypothetical protein